MARIARGSRAQRWTAAGPRDPRPEPLAGEEPLEVRLDGEPFTVTMRTPGDDLDLVAGFLVSEGVVAAAAQLRAVAAGAGVTAEGRRDDNVVDVRLGPGAVPPAAASQRHVYVSSSCGICGTASVEAVRKASRHAPDQDPLRVPVDQLLVMPDLLRERQRVFGRTGGTHAAALLRPAVEGAAGSPEVLCVREDVGRHNAVDKVVGWALRQDLLPLAGTVLQVSGRASFELVQKAAMAGVPVLSAVSAPSAAAADLGEETGVTVVGFNRGDRLTVYSRPERVVAGSVP
ncbi:formate dehydrogenase accessory sulfurtransferase FdhD [Ornithinicoccus halotolerans]|uniref:formate dehydrogenase accessory sulfurtransferase FdhD n=1 Tax=Ornithinicoccus halotolerans TaxID=1748220 RepID=UPI0012972A47|nr:formate dehydrogenase accessory sulfurtransferase FdhD [Ornithinicoccus halotolerans]